MTETTTQKIKSCLPVESWSDIDICVKETMRMADLLERAEVLIRRLAKNPYDDFVNGWLEEMNEFQGKGE